MSKLRCRVGDIVVCVIRDENYGKLGTVAGRLTAQEAARFPKDVLHWRVEALGSKFHVTDSDSTRFWEDDHILVNDAEVRPLRDDPGVDEMLRITGKPKKVRAPKRQTGRGEVVATNKPTGQAQHG